MTVQRFVGDNNRDVMRRVRAALGDDALILANRQVEEGVEILAMTEEAAESGAEPDRTDPPVARTDTGAGLEQYLAQRVVAAGLGRELAQALVSSLPGEVASRAEADEWLVRRLRARLAVTEDPVRTFDAGGVLALVGPTGVGKTTTVAKMAARYAMRHGPESVALVSADHYRIGARDHLRLYADIIGVPLYALEEGETLDTLPRRLAERSLVLVDTAGMGQRDERVANQLAQLRGGPRPVQRYLLLNAAAHRETLEETVAAYRDTARDQGADVDAVILSKKDEAPRLGPALASLIRHGLPLHFVVAGQRVPEDLMPADGDALVAEALAAAPLADDSDESCPMDALARGLSVTEAVAGLREQVPEFGGLEQLWARGTPERVPGNRIAALAWFRGRQSSHPLALDGAGLPLAAAVGETAREEATRLLASPPGGNEAFAMADDGRDWLATGRASTRVLYRGDRWSLGELRLRARGCVTKELRHRGRLVQVRCAYLPVALPASGRGRFHSLCQAWFGELRNLDTGADLGRRFWLLPANLDESACEMLIAWQLCTEEFPGLVDRATDLLLAEGTTPVDDADQMSRLVHGLAALACRLDQDDSQWSVDLRAHLLGFLPRRRRRTSRTLLEGLVRMFRYRDTLGRLTRDLPAETV